MTTAAAPGPDNELVQMNVRIPKSLRDQIDARRKDIGENGVSRDKWVAAAAEFALRHPTRSTATTTAPGRRTAPPPHRR